GTQMSLPYDERVVVRRNGKTEVSKIGALVDRIMESAEVEPWEVETDDVCSTVGVPREELEVLSLGNDEKVKWKR
ncbi:MAG: hypothetical protein SV377_01420, partial [Halobacteria archaeon]|nr:hypothetical protein [Halobacteria archaeon]